jgi:hypothetical protein
MAFAMIGGIIAATLLTLLFLPALYVAWYGIREKESMMYGIRETPSEERDLGQRFLGL